MTTLYIKMSFFSLYDCKLTYRLFELFFRQNELFQNISLENLGLWWAFFISFDIL